MLPLPTLGSGSGYQPCCGKEICCGCMYAVAKRDKDQRCPFCRIPAYKTDKEQHERLEKRVESGDANAIYNLGCCYRNGDYGLQKDNHKAFSLFLRAADLGNVYAYAVIGAAYYIMAMVWKGTRRWLGTTTS